MQSNARLPFWVSSNDINELNSILGNLLDSNLVKQQERDIAMQISQEIGVATTRFSHSRIPANLLQHALNVSSQDIPLHFSKEEVEFIQTLDIPPQLRSALDD